jgi:hypothetical protein
MTGERKSEVYLLACKDLAQIEALYGIDYYISGEDKNSYRGENDEKY